MTPKPVLPNKRPLPGKAFQSSARVQNTLIDVANQFIGEQVGLPSGGPTSAWGHPCLIAVVKNTTAGDLSAGSILTPGTASSIGTFPANPHETRRRPFLSCGAPTGSTSAVCVLVDPVGAGKYGRAAVSGVTVCTVNMTDANHNYANPSSADTAKLTSGEYGSVRILHKSESGTGEKTCIVQLQSWKTEESAVTSTKLVRIIEHDGTTPYPITVREVTWDGVSATSYTDVDGSGASDFEAFDFDGNYARTAAQFAAAGCTGIHIAYGPDTEGDYHLVLSQPAGYTASNYKTTSGGAGHYGGYVNIAGQRFKGRKWFGTTAIGEDDVPGFTDDGGLWTSNFCVTVGGDVGTADSTAGDGTGGYDADRWTMYANNSFGGVGTTQALFVAPPSFLDSSGKMDGDECTTAVISDGTYEFEGFSVGGSYVVTSGNQEDPENPGNYITSLNLGANTSGLIPIDGSGGVHTMARIIYVTSVLGIGGSVRVWDGAAYTAGASGKLEYTTGKYLYFEQGICTGWT